MSQHNAPARLLLVATTSTLANDAIEALIGELEAAKHQVEVVSYAGIAAQSARSLAEKGLRGLKAAVRTVTGRITGEDPLGLAEPYQTSRFDAIIVTHPDLFAATRILTDHNTLCLGLVPNLDLHPGWTQADADAIILPHPALREHFANAHWPEESLFDGASLVAPSFSKDYDKNKNLKDFGIDPQNGPILLTIAPSFDEVQLERLLFQLSLLKAPVQHLIFAGDQSRTMQLLRKFAAQYQVVARMFPLVDDLPRIFALADLALLHAEAPELHNLLALGKALLILDDGQMNPLTSLLQRLDAAAAAPDLTRFGAELDHILHDPPSLNRLDQGAKNLAKHAGTEPISNAIHSALAARTNLLNRAAHLRHQKATAPAPAAPPAGPFEVIGQASTTPTTPPKELTAGNAPTPAPSLFVTTHPNPSRPNIEPKASISPAAQKAVHAELTELILLERNIERRLNDAMDLTSKWEQRLELAKNANDHSLLAEATRFLDAARAEERDLLRELDQVRHRKKSALDFGQRTPSLSTTTTQENTDLEGRFRALEMERQMQRLKDRMRQDFGDD